MTDKNDLSSLIELEKISVELVSELTNIKKSSDIYDDAKISLTKLSDELIDISSRITTLIESIKSSTNITNNTLIKSNEILTDQIQSNEKRLDEIDSTLTESIKSSTNITNKTLIKSNEILTDQIQSNEKRLDEIDSTLTESIKSSTNITNKTLKKSNEILIEQSETNEQSLKKINSSFKRFQNELKTELEDTKNLIYKDNSKQFKNIETKISDKFETFSIRGAIGFTVVSVLIIVGTIIGIAIFIPLL